MAKVSTSNLKELVLNDRPGEPRLRESNPRGRHAGPRTLEINRGAMASAGIASSRASSVHLRHASIMPSADVVGRLPTWMARTQSLICNLTSLLVTDSVLEALAPNLAPLEQFYSPYWLSTQRPNAPRRHRCSASTSAVPARLHSFTLSVHECTPLPGSRLAPALALLARAPLLEICDILLRCRPSPLPAHCTPPPGQRRRIDFWRALVDAHGPRLTRVSVHRMVISLHAVGDACVRCPVLRQLVVVSVDWTPSQPAPRMGRPTPIQLSAVLFMRGHEHHHRQRARAARVPLEQSILSHGLRLAHPLALAQRRRPRALVSSRNLTSPPPPTALAPAAA
ncbi:hypothetical protein B0H14DRAFT_3470388 [Mycena olivaceomarginata]|nr:hypothetical protein B0H14DRAFT_3470388 [Mycena olivaceomarginata]